MKLSSRKLVLLLLASNGAAGCKETKAGADAGPTGSGSLTVSGPVESTVQGEGQPAVILWEVTSGSPDYGYKWGEGIVRNGRFAITLPGDPPAEAINSFGLGIGLVMVLAPGVVLPDGRVTSSIFSPSSILGLSTRGSIVWRAKSWNFGDTAIPAGWWPDSFPVGYACGACTPAPDSGGFDGFEPTSCDQIQISPNVTENVCNWT